MRRPFAAALASLLTAVLSVSADQLATAATVSTQPVFVSPSTGESVSGHIQVTLKSESPYVRLRMLPGPDRLGVLAMPTSDGQATASIDSFGLLGSETIWASDCNDSQFTDCGPEVSVTVDVHNAGPAWSTPLPERVTAGQLIRADLRTSIHHKYAWAVDPINGRVDMGYWPGGSTAQPRFATPYEGAGLHDGRRVFAVGWCQEWLNRCAATPSGRAVIEYQQTLDPDIVHMSRHRITPNLDGRGDSTEITYTVDTRQHVRFALVDSTGHIATGPISAGERKAGEYSWTLGNRHAGDLRPGEYTVRMRTRTLIVDAWQLQGEAGRRLTVAR